MEFIVQLFKIGDRTMLPLPREAVTKLGIQDGDLMQLTVEDGVIVVKRAVEAMEERKKQIEKFTKELFEEKADVFRALAESERLDAERQRKQDNQISE